MNGMSGSPSWYAGSSVKTKVYWEVGQGLIKQAERTWLSIACRNYLTCPSCFVMETKFQVHWKYITELLEVALKVLLESMRCSLMTVE